MIKNNIYSLCPKSEYIDISLKVFADETYYSHINNWQEYIDYFNKILPDEVNYNISKENIKKWHSLLQQYLSNQPNKHRKQNRIFSQEMVTLENAVENDL